MGTEEAEHHHEREKDIDARDYFYITSFQKAAEAIDLDPSHQWESVRAADETIWIQSPYGKVMVGITHTPAANEPDQPNGILIAEQSNQNEGTSTSIDHLTGEQLDDILFYMHLILTHLPDEPRHKYVQRIISEIEECSDQEITAEIFIAIFLDFLPDHPDQIEIAQRTNLETLIKETIPTDLQQKLINFIASASRKVNGATSTQLMNEIHTLLSEPTTNIDLYEDIIATILNTVLKNNIVTEKQYGIVQKGSTAMYTIKDKAPVNIPDIETLTRILQEMPIENMPPIPPLKQRAHRPGFVHLEKVVGGYNFNTWTISGSPGRGLPRIFALMHDLLSGEKIVTGPKGRDPIYIMQIGEKYYVMEGRHRIAALKALGVKEVPAMISTLD